MLSPRKTILSPVLNSRNVPSACAVAEGVEPHNRQRVRVEVRKNRRRVVSLWLEQKGLDGGGEPGQALASFGCGTQAQDGARPAGQLPAGFG